MESWTVALERRLLELWFEAKTKYETTMKKYQKESVDLGRTGEVCWRRRTGSAAVAGGTDRQEAEEQD